MVKAILSAAVVGFLMNAYSTEAQPISASFYGSDDCEEQEVWRIRGPRELCLLVPNNPTTSYIVYCNTATGGTFIPCSDNECGNCPPIAQKIFTNNQCFDVAEAYSPNLPGVSVNCAIGQDVAPLKLVGASNTALITYYPTDDCTLPDGYRTEFVVGSGACNAINGNPATPAMDVTCLPDGAGGNYRLFGDVACAGAPSAATPFVNGQCLPQGPAGGNSGSINIVCSPVEPDVVEPLPSASAAPVMPSASASASTMPEEDLTGASSAGRSNLGLFAGGVAAASVALATAMTMLTVRG